MRDVRLLFIIVLIHLPLYAVAFEANFDELDKPPEGAHKGQMLVGAFINAGVPFGDCIDAENSFIDGSTYTFNNDVTKEIELSHLAFGFGLLFEYMPIDHLGAKTKFKRSYIIQRSNFGPEYQNWNGVLYEDFSLYLGPSGHLTTRKRWDFTLTPMVGIAFAKYSASPVGKKILTDSGGNELSGGTKKSFVGLTYGIELNCTIYFSGGLFVSLGADWTRNSCNFGSSFDIVNPQDTDRTYLDGASEGTIDTISFALSAGYAFLN